MYKKILLAVDVADENSWRASLPQAVALARTCKAKLHIVTVIPDFSMTMLSPYFAENAEARLQADAEAKLQAFITANLPTDIVVESSVAQGTIYRKIIDTAKTIQADIIVVSAHRPDYNEYLLGPNAAKVARHSTINVLIAR